MVNYCCVNGCSRNSRLSNHLNYYTFPKDKARQEQWLKLVGREDLIGKGDLKSGYRVCSRHFAPTSIKEQSINLCPDAVPTLCLPSDSTEKRDDFPLHHDDIVCNSCQKPIQGFRYKCVSCDDYDLCPKCETLETHSHHFMLRIPRPMKFKIADQLIKKWRDFFRAEHVKPDCGDSGSGADDSDDDEPITKYARQGHDSGVELEDEIKNRIREEVIRVTALKRAEKRKKKKEKIKAAVRKRSGSELAKPSKKPKNVEIELKSPFPAPAPEVAFADVNEIKSEDTSMIITNTETAFEPSRDRPMMHMRLSDDLSELMIEMDGETKTVFKYT